MLEGKDFEPMVDPVADALAKHMSESLSLVRSALADLLTAEAHLMNAAGKVFNTPEDDRLSSLAMSVEDLECDLRRQIKRMERLVEGGL